MKKLLLILTLLTSIPILSQTYECKDNTDKVFNIFITQGHYNFVLDSFLIVTKLDTIIITERYTKYIPSNNLNDTMTIFENHYITFTSNYGGDITHFTIIRQLNEFEINALMRKKYITINSN